MSSKQDPDEPSRTSHLFTLRLWPEDLGGGQTDWRGKVQHVQSGEVRYFRDWLALEAFVEELLRRTETDGAGMGEGRATGRTP